MLEPIYTLVDTIANILINLKNKQRAITTDGGKNWVYRDNSGEIHVTANQRKWTGSAWVYEDNDFGAVTVHDLPAVTEQEDGIVVSDSGRLSIAQLEDLVSGFAAADHTHSSIETSGEELTVLASGIVELPGGNAGFKGTAAGIDIYQKVGESWVLSQSLLF